MSDTGEPDSGEPAIYCRHLIVCRTVWFDPNRPDDGFSLGKIVVQLRPPAGQGFPLVVPRLFAYVQLYGTAGEYRIWLRLVRIEEDESGDEAEKQLGLDEEPLEFIMPRPAVLSGLAIVEEVAIPLERLVFDQPGTYALQLWAEGEDEPLTGERFEVAT